MEQQQFEEQLRVRTARIEDILRGYLPEEAGFQKTVLKAMNYSLMAGGKRLRPMLLQETYHMLGGKGREAEPFMAAIEMIHTYSLVHDDLPAMDNDDYRRGRKTTHIEYGEAFGILAGDALLNYAFETALGACSIGKDGREISAEKLQAMVRALHILAVKSGVFGMIGGQTADIEAEAQTQALTGEQLLYIHEHKTAALIQAAMMAGAVLAGAGEAALQKIEKCAYNVGIAFQIQDDILDVTGDSRELGKQVGSDARNRKQTYVTIFGLEQSVKDVSALSGEAVDILDSFEGEHEFLKQLILMLIHRTK